MRRVHIHARDVAYHDAVGNFCLQVYDLLSAAGWSPQLWAGHADQFPGLQIGHRDALPDAVRDSDLIFENFSIYDPILERLSALPNRKVLYYHNITPPELIDPTDVTTVENCRLGRGQRHLAASFDQLLANSTASANDLIEGFHEVDRRQWEGFVQVAPPFVGVKRWRANPSIEPEPSHTPRLLFVGRLVRHKAVLELLDVLETLTSLIEGVSLDIVGNPPHGAYVESIKQRATDVQNATGSSIRIWHGITDGQLEVLYQEATACITLSRHEGFCVPAADALAFSKPFFFAHSDAVSEVVGAAGVAIPNDNPRAAAEIISGILKSKTSLAHLAGLSAGNFALLRTAGNGESIIRAVTRAGERS